MKKEKNSRSAYHHGDLRRALLDAALVEVQEGDPQAISFRDLARMVGVSTAAPYFHFRDRGELLAVLASEGFAALHEALQKAKESSKSSQQVIDDLVGAYIRFGRTNKGHYGIMYLPLVTDAHNIEHARPHAESCFGQLVACIASHRPDLPNRLVGQKAVAIWALVHGIVSLGGAGPLSLKTNKSDEIKLAIESARLIIGITP